MSFFKLDVNNVSSTFELVAEGKYEAVIINAEAGKTQAGKDKLTVDFEIRSDVDQKHTGAKILYTTFTFEHEVAQKIVNGFIKACGFAHGHAFTSPEDMAQQLFNKNVLITVKHEEYTKDGEKRTAAKAKYFDITKFPTSTNNPTIEVGQDDLPF